MYFLRIQEHIVRCFLKGNAGDICVIVNKSLEKQNHQHFWFS